MTVYIYICTSEHIRPSQPIGEAHVFLFHEFSVFCRARPFYLNATACREVPTCVAEVTNAYPQRRGQPGWAAEEAEEANQS